MNDSVDMARDVCKPPANYDQDLSQMLRDLSGYKRARSPFYKDATFFTSQEVSQLLDQAGFHSILVRQIPLPRDDDPLKRFVCRDPGFGPVLITLIQGRTEHPHEPPLYSLSCFPRTPLLRIILELRDESAQWLHFESERLGIHGSPD